MKNNSKEPDVEVPLKPTNSIDHQDVEEEPEVEENNKSIVGKAITDCFGTFLNGTSIRGVKQCLNSPHFLLRMFWFFFILLSFTLVITVSSFCIISYCKYQTVVRQTKRPVTGGDFPVITLCSDGLFGDSEAIRDIANHPRIYDDQVMSKMELFLKSGQYSLLKKVSWLRTMVLYNVNNIKTLQELMADELNIRSYKEFGVYPRLGPDVKCMLPEGRLCKINAFYDLKYRNCISLRIPDSMRNSKLDRMVINGILLSSSEPPILPQPNVIDDVLLSGRHIHVFLHEKGTLPRAIPDFVISLTQDRWILIDFDVTHLTRKVTPVSKCAESPVKNTSHAGELIRLSPSICRDVKLREVIRTNCKCEYSEPPFDKWPLKKRHFCGYWANASLEAASKELQCVQEQVIRAQDEKVECVIPCSEKIYQSRISINDLNRKSFNRIMKENLIGMLAPEIKTACSKKRRNRSRCNRSKELLMKLIEKTNASLIDERKFVDYQKRPKKYFRKFSFPPMTEKDLENSVELEKASFTMTIRCPKLQVDAEDEELVRSIWTTLAQVGGASSFLAGFTFGVLAEIIDTVYKVYVSKTKQN